MIHNNTVDVGTQYGARARDAILTRDDEIRLFTDMASSDDRIKRKARDELITSNIRLIVSIAKRFQTICEMQDLIQEGVFGLMRAIETFNVARNVRFSTYASWWIRQALNQFVVNRSKCIRLPAHVLTIKKKIRAEREKYMCDMGFEPSDEYIRQKLKLSQKMFRAAMHATSSVISIDAPRYASDPDSSSWESYIFDDTSQHSSDDEIDSCRMRELIDVTFQSLSTRESMAFKLRHNLT